MTFSDHIVQRKWIYFSNNVFDTNIMRQINTNSISKGPDFSKDQTTWTNLVEKSFTKSALSGDNNVHFVDHNRRCSLIKTSNVIMSDLLVSS